LSRISQIAGMAAQVGLLGIEFIDLHLARLARRSPMTMPLLMFEITRRCNLSCQYCGYPRFYPDYGRELSTEEVRAILRDCVDLKTRIVSFGGGEPFMRPDFIEIVAFARSLGLNVHIDSNGTMIDEDVVGAIPDGADVTIIFSLDHPDADVNDRVRGPGSHAGVTRAARLLRELRPSISVGINCVVGSHNVDWLERMVELADGLGVGGISFLPLHANLQHQWRFGDDSCVPLVPADPETVHRAMLAATALARSRGLHTNSRRFNSMAAGGPKSRRAFQCWAGYLFGNIDPYGNLFPCYDIMDKASGVREVGLKAAWRGPGMERLRSRVRRCEADCVSSGAIEASLRMNPTIVASDPVQLIEDLRFFLGSGRSRR